MITVDDMVRREVLMCLSPLISTLASVFECDNVNAAMNELHEQAQELARPVDDYQEAAEQAGWAGPFKDQFGATYFEAESEEAGKPSATWVCADWEALCREHDIEPYEWEVFEHWAVSSWLGEKLKEQGERVDDDFAGMVVWARTTTGQGIASDGVIQRIHRALVES